MLTMDPATKHSQALIIAQHQLSMSSSFFLPLENSVILEEHLRAVSFAIVRGLVAWLREECLLQRSRHLDEIEPKGRGFKGRGGEAAGPDSAGHCECSIAILKLSPFPLPEQGSV